MSGRVSESSSAPWSPVIGNTAIAGIRRAICNVGLIAPTSHARRRQWGFGLRKSLHERLGFRLEGELRRMAFTEGQYFDEWVFGMTAEEFTARYADLD